MLRSLSISNYALIAEATIAFDAGFSVITGETGAGKSILLGALGLITGKRADSSSAGDATQKCIVEGVFDIEAYSLRSFFETHDLDYESDTIVRREILPSGKSRAFINDTPVNLSQLQTLGNRLIDIHSQHKTMDVVGSAYQFEVLDTCANASDILKEYTVSYNALQDAQERLQRLKTKKEKAQLEFDYQQFLYNELEAAAIKPGEFEQLEEELKSLNHAEEIAAQLQQAQLGLSQEDRGVLDQLREVLSQVQRIAGYAEVYASLGQRIQSAHIELDDIASEIEQLASQVVSDPAALAQMNERAQVLYNLMQKHKVSHSNELLEVQSGLEKELIEVSNVDDAIAETTKVFASAKAKSLTLANRLHKRRKQAIAPLENEITTLLKELGMEHARFVINLSDTGMLHHNGSDRLEFLFSANEGMDVRPLSKGASGGELSRVMLAVKAVMSTHKKLPSLVFDEIDTGVSGAVAIRMADILKKMGQHLQLVSITHLPQIAAQGSTHFKVYKKTSAGKTTTYIHRLTQQQRVEEIATMLGGAQKSEAALAHARNLLG
ncbi:MAG: DNA repair protein RecN [Dokdonia sp.]